MLVDPAEDAGDSPGVSVTEQRPHLTLQNRKVRQYLCLKFSHASFSISHSRLHVLQRDVHEDYARKPRVIGRSRAIVHANGSSLHERLRREISRRIDRGLLTGTLLTRQTGLQSSHISKRLHRKRKLSLAALDRVLASQRLSIEDLMPSQFLRHLPALPDIHIGKFDSVHLSLKPPLYKLPVLLQRPRSKLSNLPLESSNTSAPAALSFAVSGSAFSQCASVPPKRFPWRPFSCLMPSSCSTATTTRLPLTGPPRPNLFAVNVGDFLSFRYVDFDANHLIRRPHALDHPVELLNLGPDESPSGCIVGHACICISEI